MSWVPTEINRSGFIGGLEPVENTGIDQVKEGMPFRRVEVLGEGPGKVGKFRIGRASQKVTLCFGMRSAAGTEGNGRIFDWRSLQETGPHRLVVMNKFHMCCLLVWLK
jgi:hypothetical protein